MLVGPTTCEGPLRKQQDRTAQHHAWVCARNEQIARGWGGGGRPPAVPFSYLPAANSVTSSRTWCQPSCMRWLNTEFVLDKSCWTGQTPRGKGSKEVDKAEQHPPSIIIRGGLIARQPHFGCLRKNTMMKDSRHPPPHTHTTGPPVTTIQLAEPVSPY